MIYYRELGELVEPVIYQSYNSTGTYMEHANWSGGLWNRVRFDEAGIPIVNYSWGDEYVPTTAFHWGLISYSRWLESGDSEHWGAALNISEWAVTTQDEQGGWNWSFNYNWYNGVAGSLEEGWYGAMTQGLGMSFLARMYDATGDERYESAALNATSLLQIEVDRGGVMRRFEGKWLWYEEYPTPDAGSYVLNGFLYTLLGLHDSAQVFDDDISQQLFEEGLQSLEQMLGLFDLGCSSSYDLTHITIDELEPNVARPGYHSIHVSLLSILNVIKENRYVEIQSRWNEYAHGACSPRFLP